VPLSLKLLLSTYTLPNQPVFLGIEARVDGCVGYWKVPWDVAFGNELTVILEPPAGGAPMKKKAIKARSTKQERKRIEAVGGRVHRGSGSREGYKSDGSSDRWRMENKFTTASSYRVTLSDLTKLRSECRNAQAPVFNIEFQDKHTAEVKETWVLVPAKEWEKLVNASDDNR
jgi:hypothetical protein